MKTHLIKVVLGISFALVSMSAVAPAATVSVTAGPNPPSENLTTGGLADWGHWGLNSATDFNRKIGGTILSDTTLVGGGSKLQGTDYTTTISWTNGTPTTTESGTPNFEYNSNFESIGQGLSFTSTFATGGSGTLFVYGTVADGTGTLHVTGSFGGSASASITSAPAANDRALFTVPFTVSAGETLTSVFTLTADSGGNAVSNTGIAAAEVNFTTAVPEPTTTTWLASALALVGCCYLRRRLAR